VKTDFIANKRGVESESSENTQTIKEINAEPSYSVQLNYFAFPIVTMDEKFEVKNESLQPKNLNFSRAVEIPKESVDGKNKIQQFVPAKVDFTSIDVQQEDIKIESKTAAKSETERD
jgi:hypothetical protein